MDPPNFKLSLRIYLYRSLHHCRHWIADFVQGHDLVLGQGLGEFHGLMQGVTGLQGWHDAFFPAKISR